MDGVLCDYKTAFWEKRKENPGVKYPQSQYDFFRNLEPIEDGITSFYTLSKYYDTYILSSPSIQNPLSYTEKRVWVEKNLGIEYVDRLILSYYKNLNKGDYLIDDSLIRGVSEFEGEHIHFGSEGFPDWTSIVLYLQNKDRLK